jgi:hypothetical protein
MVEGHRKLIKPSEMPMLFVIQRCCCSILIKLAVLISCVTSIDVFFFCALTQGLDEYSDFKVIENNNFCKPA